MTQDEAIGHLRDYAEERAKEKKRAAEVRDELRRFCRAARDAGVPISLIASEAKISRQAVYDVLAEQPAS
jgi:DNA invertase Pin-like site-specific DNA recombinase